MLNFDYQNLNFYNPVGNKLYCKSFVLNDDKCTDLGFLFLTVSIGGGVHKGSKIADILQEVSRLEYFNYAPDKSPDPIKNFEKTINKINQTFTTLIESNHLEWLDSLNLAIASVYNNKIQLVCTGNIKVYLFRENSLMSLNNNKAASKTAPAKIFKDIVSGTIQKRDKLFFSTKEVLDYFNEENLKNIVTQNSPKEASFKLQSSLSQNQNNADSIASIFIEAIDESEKDIKEKLDLPELDKIDKLEELETVDKTKNTIQDIRENPKAIFDIAKNASLSIINASKKIVNIDLKKINVKRTNENTATSNEEEKNYSHSYKSKFSPSPNNIIDKILYYANALLKKYHSLPLTSKIFSITSIVFAFAFLISISFQAGSKSSQEESDTIKGELLKATENEKLAADALIYSDFSKAKDLLFEAQNILNQPEIKDSEVKETKEEREDISQKISEHFDKIDKIIRIDDPLQVVEIPKDFDTNKILGIDNSVYVFNPNTNAIYSVEESSKKLSPIFDNSTNLGFFNKAGANSAKNNLFFVTSDMQVAEYDIDLGEIEEVDITYAKTDQEITDLVFYNDRLYILDSKNNQIYKHTRSISGYSKGLTWVKENEYDLTQGISFTIDGEIYALNRDGGVIKFLNGYFKDFAIQQPSKPATSPSKIFTKLDYQYLYILDPDNNRLLVFNKQSGEFINQYVSDKFTDMRDMYIDEANRKAFLLCGNDIYGVVLESSQ